MFLWFIITCVNQNLILYQNLLTELNEVDCDGGELKHLLVCLVLPGWPRPWRWRCSDLNMQNIGWRPGRRPRVGKRWVGEVIFHDYKDLQVDPSTRGRAEDLRCLKSQGRREALHWLCENLYCWLYSTLCGSFFKVGTHFERLSLFGLPTREPPTVFPGRFLAVPTGLYSRAIHVVDVITKIDQRLAVSASTHLSTEKTTRRRTPAYSPTLKGRQRRYLFTPSFSMWRFRQHVARTTL